MLNLEQANRHNGEDNAVYDAALTLLCFHKVSIAVWAFKVGVCKDAACSSLLFFFLH